ncbi:MAG: hypothetical protein RhofKO_38680 [Rhodothermales bacterium]
MAQIDFEALQAFFPPNDIEWKPIATSKRTGKGLAAAYLDTRAIMARLDAVCGPQNWRNEFAPGPNGGLLCGLSIRTVREDGSAEWVTKWDGAENTDVESVKGGLSSAMKRAASQWGIGRYLYQLPNQWVPMNEHGRFAETPRIPREFMPRGTSNGQRPPHASNPTAPRSPQPQRSNGQTAPRPNDQPRNQPQQRQPQNGRPASGQQRQYRNG